MKLDDYLNAGFCMVYLETKEIKRAVRSIVSDEYIYYWNPLKSLSESATLSAEEIEKARSEQSGTEMDQATQNLDEMSPQDVMNAITGQKKESETELLDQIIQLPDKSVIILENFGHIFEGDKKNSITQKILNTYEMIKNQNKLMVVIGDNYEVIPPILEEYCPQVKFDLPDEKSITDLVDELTETTVENIIQDENDDTLNRDDLAEELFDGTTIENVIEVCKGLTYEEMSNALSLSLVKHSRFDIETISHKRRMVLKNTGFMDFWEPVPSEDVGGLEYVKDFFEARKEPFHNPKSIKPKLKSILLLGVQGCGKSLLSRLMGDILGCPIINLDVGATSSKWKGEQGRKIRIATDIIDAFGFVGVVVDEVEKEFGGTSGVNADSTDSQLLKHWLTWNQERTSDGIIVCTANSIDGLPPEFIDRNDACFFVGFPNKSGIRQVIDIKNRQWNSKLPTTDKFIEQLYKENWTPRAIERLAKEWHYEPDLQKAMKNVPLISRTKKDELAAMIKKAEGKFRPASKPDKVKKEKVSKLDLGKAAKRSPVVKRKGRKNA